MSYKYYSIMRPVGIGTYPSNRTPVKIINYPDKQKVSAADGRTLEAWGEIEFDEPLSSYEMYRFELKGDYEYPPFKYVGYWQNDVNGIKIIQIEGRFFALNRWNGTYYSHCWECETKFKVKGDTEYAIKPVYRFETDMGKAEMESLYEMEEGSDEWNAMSDRLNEIISFEVT